MNDKGATTDIACWYPDKSIEIILVVVFSDNGKAAVNIFWYADKSIDNALVVVFKANGEEAVNIFCYKVLFNAVVEYLVKSTVKTLVDDNVNGEAVVVLTVNNGW